MGRIVWAGGPHGVGKTSGLRLAADNDPSVAYIYLGRIFYETAIRMGFQWMDLADETKLLCVEEIVTRELAGRVECSDLLIDCHFAIYFGGDTTHPGFHRENLKRLSSASDHKTGILYLMADPVTILERRRKSKKRFKAYKTQEDVDTIRRELSNSEEYWRYFIDALEPLVVARKVDTSKISPEEVANKIREIQNAI